MLPPPPPSRTDWTRLVRPPVLTGHAASLLHRWMRTSPSRSRRWLRCRHAVLLPVTLSTLKVDFSLFLGPRPSEIPAPPTVTTLLHPRYPGPHSGWLAPIWNLSLWSEAGVSDKPLGPALWLVARAGAELPVQHTGGEQVYLPGLLRPGVLV